MSYDPPDEDGMIMVRLLAIALQSIAHSRMFLNPVFGLGMFCFGP